MFDPDAFESQLRTDQLGRIVQLNQVVLSVDVAALQLGREQEAAHGALLVAEQEVAPKVRLGEPWTEGGQAAAFVLRPDLPATYEGRLWLAAVMAMAEAIDGRVRWPDTVVAAGVDAARVNVTSTLVGPAIGLAVLSFRVPDVGAWPAILARLANGLETLLVADDLVDRTDALLVDLGSRVRIGLMPRGETIGIVAGVTPTGALRLEMGSGRLADLPVGQARSLNPMD